VALSTINQSNKYLLGQYVEDVQDDDWLPLPTHCFPSYFGAGSSHDLVLVYVPVAVLPDAVQEIEHVP